MRIISFGSILIPAVLVPLASGRASAGDEPGRPPVAFARASPDGPAELAAMQGHLRRLAVRLTPSVLMVQSSRTNGTGVIIGRDGLFLTAGHVAGPAGEEATVSLADGRTLKAKTLGIDRRADVAMFRIVGGGDLVPAEIGRSDGLRPGAWCVVLGYPGGFEPGREPELRVGRLLSVGTLVLRTDCVTEGGDSGSPLFDMDGRVIGLGHALGRPRADGNLAIPIDRARASWDRLLRGEAWGDLKPTGQATLEAMPSGGTPCRVREVKPGSSAERAGVRVGDTITRLEGRTIASESDLDFPFAGKTAGDEITFDVLRDGATITIRMVLDPSRDD